MAKEGSVAPQERINITYKPATGDAQEQVELPLKMMFIGDYSGREDTRPLEDRAPVNVDKDNFQQVLREHNLALSFGVKDQLTGEEGGELPVKLQFKSLSDFGPDSIVQQVPELKKLMELREALTALKGPLGNIPGFRRKIQALLDDAEARSKLLGELGLSGGGE
jgi:type VI secretion system protein ImpB